MAAFDVAIEFLHHAQVEIIVIVLAGLLHPFFFSKQGAFAIRNKVRFWASGEETRTGWRAEMHGALAIKSKVRFWASDASSADAPAPAAKSNSHGARLLRSVQSLLHGKATPGSLEEAMNLELANLSNAAAEAAFTELLDDGFRLATVDLLAALRGAMRSRGLLASGRLGEQLLKVCHSLHQPGEFQAVLAEIESSPAGASTLTCTLALRAAIVEGDIESSLARLQPLGKAWQASLTRTPFRFLHRCLQQLCQLALAGSNFAALLGELQRSGLITQWSLELLLGELEKQGAVTALRSTWELAISEGVPLSPAARCSLIRGLDSEDEVLRLFAPAGGQDRELLLAASEAAARLHSKALAQEVLAVTPAAPDAEVVSALVRLVGTLKGFGGGLRESFRLFHACPERTSALYNAMLAACVECRDIAAAEQIMTQASRDGMANMMTYNTVIKGYLQAGKLEHAREAMKEMHAEGFAPNCVHFNEVIDATISMRKIGTVWHLIEEMEALDVKPNLRTCSILLKSIRHAGQAADLDRTLRMVDALDADEEMDEVVFCSVCEACIRANRPDILRQRLQQQRTSNAVKVTGERTVATLVRGFCFIEDVEGVWATWREMRSNSSTIRPTCITVGCMVEAVVSSEGPEAGYEVIREVFADEQTRPLLNDVIYASVLKGFSRLREFDKVWELYEEMLAQKLQFSIATYNTLVDACARCEQMSWVPRILSDMVSRKVEPDVITYTAMLKGYCREQNLKKAFSLLEEMKRSSKCQPDEIAYAQLIDACARFGRLEMGAALLDEMEEAGVKPGNCTLAAAVKMARRSKEPEKAFDVCYRLALKYRLRINVHVYNNLMQASTSGGSGGDTDRAMGVFVRMLSDRVKPDQRSYEVLLCALVLSQQWEEAAGLLRAAAGLRRAHPALARFDASLLRPHGGVAPELVSKVLRDMSRPGGDPSLAEELLQELRSSPSLRLDSDVRPPHCAAADGGSSSQRPWSWRPGELAADEDATRGYNRQRGGG